jgi:phosphoribosyl-ATP pyrophosphohydrolase
VSAREGQLGAVLTQLFATIEARKGADAASSYTASLFARGRQRIAQKVGEEAVETALAAVAGDTAAIASESADLLYHLCVLWADAGLTPDDIAARLAAREGTSGLAEKHSRAE